MKPLEQAAQRRSMAAAALVIVLWASSFVAVKLALTDLDPGPLALTRYGVAALVFLGLHCFRRCKLPSLPDCLRLALSGALGIALYNYALNRGQLTVSAGVASLIVNTVPLWTALLSALFLRESISPMGWLGALISFSGVALICWSRAGLTGFDSGISLILLAALSQAAYFILIKPLLQRYTALDLTSYVVWFGFLFLLPFGAGLAEDLQASSMLTLGAVLFLGIGPAALAYLAWSYVLSTMPAGRASNLLFLVPVVAIALGWIVLGETPPPIAVLGGAVAIGGVLLSRKSALPSTEEGS